MPKIFFCYRREDSIHQTGRIFDQLSIQFGKAGLFRDVDSMPLGVDFRRVLAEKVAQCDVLLAIIGDKWLAPTETGARRLDDAADFVRIEIESALNRNIPVIPVLVGDALLPKPDELPAALHEFPFRHGLPVRPDPDFHRDIERLVRGINELVVLHESHATGSHGAVVPTAPANLDSPLGNSVEGGLLAGLGAHVRSYMDKLARSTPELPRVNPPRAPAPGESNVRIGILKSGNATYVNEIERALLGTLNAARPRHRLCFIPSHDYVEWSDQDRWSVSAARLLSRGCVEGFQFLICIGTQAAVALHAALGARFGKTPTLLLGVSYPRLCGLVDSDYYRCENRQVACIRYGCGVDAVASLLHHRIFPGRRLSFVFQSGVPQDEMAYRELCSTRFVRDGLLRLHRFDPPLTTQDLPDDETVYFSWYTFSRLFHEKEFSILKERLTVSIMQDDVRDGAAIAGVGTDHDWIGEQGADVILQHCTAPATAKPDWGSRDVMVAPILYWLNRRLARKRGIEFTEVALDGANEVYD